MRIESRSRFCIASAPCPTTERLFTALQSGTFAFLADFALMANRQDEHLVRLRIESV